MAFHHDAHGRAAFGPKKPSGPTSPRPKPMPVKAAPPKHGEPQAPHGEHQQEEHVTKTHPGKTKPHPTTGVHAFHAHHTGGGMYSHHTHHDDGTVASEHNQSHDDTMAAHDEAFPPEGQETAEGEGAPMPGGEDYGDVMGGVGGENV